MHFFFIYIIELISVLKINKIYQYVRKRLLVRMSSIHSLFTKLILHIQIFKECKNISILK